MIQETRQDSCNSRYDTKESDYESGDSYDSVSHEAEDTSQGRHYVDALLCGRDGC